MSRDLELLTAVDIAGHAGAILLEHMSPAVMQAREKGERDVVTAADFAAERYVRDRLRATFPDDGMVGEEGTDTADGARRRWHVDPLDGTLNFSRGLPVWCVSLALVEDGQPTVGVIHDPVRGETFSGQRGGGAWLNGEPIATRQSADLSAAFVHLTVDFHEGSMTAGLRDLAAVAPRVLRTRNIGSAALALAYVAAGRFDAVLHHFANSWDYAAGVLLVREAGGEVTQTDGTTYTVAANTVLSAANRALHRDLLRVIGP